MPNFAAICAAPLITALSPPQSPPLVRIPILFIADNSFFYGAGEGNRTPATSLEGLSSTTELLPQNFIED